MSQLRSVLDELLDAWRDARLGVIAELKNIPASRYDFRPVPEARSVREMAQHILEVAMMATGELTRPDTNLRRAPWQKLLARYAKPAWRARTKRELLALMRSQLDQLERRFRARGELALFQYLTRFDGNKGTKLAWAYHAVAQEEYHRGQLATYQRLMGIEPALTKLIRGG
jgi:uncharacterized damage-inducible protein DinB